MKTSHWTTRDGKTIKVKDLTDDHLRNIIRDGYRNKSICAEAKRRGIIVPEVRVTVSDIFMLKEAMASCAIEGIRSPGLEATMQVLDTGDTETVFKILHHIKAQALFDAANNH